MTPDPYAASGGPADPQSWNRYSYVLNDPVNANDPSGLCDVIIAGITQRSVGAEGLNDFATLIGANLAFPYSGGISKGVDLIEGLGSVAAQAIKANPSTETAAIAILLAAQDKGPINVFTFSGGAQALATAIQYLPANITDRIQNITYISPGGLSALPAGNGKTTAVLGKGFDYVLPPNTFPLGTQFVYTNCGHDPNCQFSDSNEQFLKTLAGSACSDPTTISRSPSAAAVGIPIAPAPSGSISFYLWEFILNNYQQEAVSSTFTPVPVQ